MSKQIKLTDELTSEEIVAMYIQPGALKENPEKVYRLDQKGKRLYYTWGEDGEPVFYMSVTTFIKYSLPTSPFLIDWIASMGKEAAKAFARERAVYGTFLHAQCAELMIDGGYNLDRIESALDDYLILEHVDIDSLKKREWCDDLKSDILAFAQFVIEYEVKPLAIEIVLTDKEMGIAGAIDMPCEMTITESGYYGEYYKSGAKSGQPKETKARRRVNAIIDIKSGRKGFFEESEIQLHAYKIMWNKHFPSTPIEKVYNWAPKNWRGATPTFTLKDQTGSKSAAKLSKLVEIAQIELDDHDSNIVIRKGNINLKAGLLENIQIMKMSDILKAHKEDAPDAEIVE